MVWRKKEEVKTETPTETGTAELERKIDFLKEKLKNLENAQTPQVIRQNPTQKPKTRTEVVKELPVQPIRQYRDDDGTIVDLITIEEALNLIVNS